MRDFKILEMFSRFGVLLMISIVTNKSEWYQDINPFNLLDIYVWAYSIGMVLALVWVSIPFYRFLENKEIEE